MYRAVVVLLVILFNLTTIAPVPSLAQSGSDSQTAANVAVELSALEASADVNSLFDRIHPDARAEIPRAAVIGWFQNEFVPLGPGVSTVTAVNFVSWTWAVTGQTYPYTAEVSFTQPFADGSVVEDVVRLVQDRNGEWRWFFGRSREFVNEQIAKYVPVAPTVRNEQSYIESVITDIDTYWAVSFAASGRSYTSPSIVDISRGANSKCRYFEPNEGPGFYCGENQTIYISIDIFLDLDVQIGDFAWITVLAHEWGHHIQALNGKYVGPGNAVELQADCLAGSYALNAETLGYLESGDLIEAVSISAIYGDPEWLPQDQAGAHGTGEDRVSAFMRGYLDGFIGCGFDLSGNQSSARSVRRVVAAPELATLLPQQNEVPSDLSHVGDRNRDLSAVVVNYTDPAETEKLFRSWGWKGNVTRSYEGTGWNSGITDVYVSIHRFDSDENAVKALEYSLIDQISSTGAWEIPIGSIGETTRALQSSADITIYVQQDDVIIRLTVTASNGDSMSTAKSIMQLIINRFE